MTDESILPEGGIAVIGMACRYPEAANMWEFWENLQSGKESLSFLSDQELEEAGISPALINNPAYVKVKSRALEGKEFFDAAFFGYAPTEARILSPQIRVFHECAWHAFEDAGYVPGQGQELIGVYAGASPGLHWEVWAKSYELEKAEVTPLWSSLLMDKYFLCTHLSYKLNLKGPALFVQTACSTSLAAIHLGTQALLNGECDLALAGGVSLSTWNEYGYLYEEGMLNSPDGRCWPFDERANGIAGGEGVGVVVLKRLEEAVMNRDFIYAVIRGSAMNNDGNRKVGFAAPSIDGQADAIKTALLLAGLEPEDIGYIETHGSGTTLGDPIEIEALQLAFNTDKKGYCAIGAVKSNIGHTDAAAGAAGFIKTVLSLHHHRIPPSLNFEKPNPRISFIDSPFYVNTRLREWCGEARPLRAGVNSFGMGGTNVHVILEEWPGNYSSLVMDSEQGEGSRGQNTTSKSQPETGREENPGGRENQLILLSARTGTALENCKKNLLDFLKRHGPASGKRENRRLDLANVAYTLQVGRKAFTHRWTAVCSNLEEAIAVLSSTAGGETHALSPGQDQGRGKTPESWEDLMKSAMARPDKDTLLRLGRLWLQGKEIDWQFLYREKSLHRVPLPLYPFEGQRYWLDDEFLNTPLKGLASKAMAKVLPGQETWFYLPGWKCTLVDQYHRCPPLIPGKWLIFLDTCGLGQLLQAKLEEAGHDVVTVTTGTVFAHPGPGHYVIDPHRPEDYQRLFTSLAEQGNFPHHLVHLWSLTGIPASETMETLQQQFETLQYYGFYSLLYITRAIENRQSAHVLRIDVISDHLHDVSGGEDIAPHKASLLAPLKVIPQEYPGIRCRSIDVTWSQADEANREEMLEQIARELELPENYQDTVVALRGQYRWVQTFEPLSLEDKPTSSPPQPCLRQKGVYLITGGLGKIGMILAEGLVKEFNARLILVSRSPVPPREQWEGKLLKISQWEAAAAEPTRVLVFSADTADEEGMRRIIHQGEQELGPISGVIHAAGLIEGETFDMTGKLTPGLCRKQFQAKVFGTLALARIFREKKNQPDFFWLMSSISAVLGGLSFTAYAAANLFMDAFSRYDKGFRQYDRSQNRCRISVNWDEVEPGETFKVFKKLLSLPIERVRQVTLSCRLPLQTRLDRWIKMETLNRQPEETAEDDPSAYLPRPSLPTPYVAPSTALQLKLAKIWKQVTGCGQIGINDDFLQIGGDSLKAITLLSRIHKEFDIRISVEEFFKEPVINGLARCIEKRYSGDKNRYVSINSSEEREYYPLSSAQKRLYILQQMEMESTAYNVLQMMIVEGELDREVLENIFRHLLQRHESLRTYFDIVNTEPVQKIQDKGEFSLEYYEVEVEEEEEGREPGTLKYTREFIRPFDLARAPLLRVGLIRLCTPPRAHSGQKGEIRAQYIFIIDMHHIITDGTSLTLLINDFITLYHGGELPALRLQYKDYSGWKNSPGGEEIKKRQEAFWLRQFADDIPLLDLPLDYQSPLVQNSKGDMVVFQMEKEETRALKELANREGVTLFILLLAIFNILLSKLTGQEDIIIGTALAGRNHADLEKIIGLFLNTLALRNYPRSSATVEEFLEEVKQRTLEAFENQDYPFEELIEKLDVPYYSDGNPLYRVMMIMQNYDTLGLEEINKLALGLKVKPFDIKPESSTNDMTLYIQEGDQLIFCLHYYIKLFKADTIERILRYFHKIASTVVTDPHVKLEEIEIITTAEREQILFRFNDTGKPLARDKFYHQLFRQQVQKSPERKAAVYGTSGEGYLHITYHQLNERANRIAAALKFRSQGANTASIIAVYMKRSINMLASIIGIFNAGFAYLPLDIDYPEERIKNILEDCRANLLITESRHAAAVEKIKESLPALETVVYLDSSGSIPGIPARYPAMNPVIAPDLHRLAYVIYTSGSTGKPKGVMIHHLGMLNHLYAKINDLSITEEDIIAQTATACFDISVWQFLAALLTGASTIIIDREIILEPVRLLQVLRKEKMTILEAVPAMANAILNALQDDNDKGLLHLKWMIITGEALGITLVREWYKRNPGIRLLNAYGPTEASDDVTHYVIDELPGISQTTIPIGKPLQNMHIYILDKHLSLCPVGVRGEICVAGLGVGKGYWQDPLKTQQAFIPNPFLEEIKDKDYITVYKTGDIGYFREDGLVEFVGRKDQQVKVRGYRIELGEIESQLAMLDDIEEAVVITIGASEPDPVPDKGEKHICAYYVAKREIDVAQLREHLGRRLPHYMVPSFFVPLQEIPLTPQGKVDRKSLPTPGIRYDNDYIPPASEKEEKLAAVFARVLKKNASEISVKSAFFEMGGHSLQAMAVVSLVKEIFQVKIPLTALFQDGTVRGITCLIEQLQGQREETALNIKPGLITPFDLGQAPLFRAKVIRMQENRHLFFIDMHHIIADGFSLELMAREFKTIYEEDPQSLPQLPVQYKDFSCWHNHFIEGESFQKQEEYWLRCFKEQIPSSSIPLDYPRPAVRKGKGNTIEQVLNPELAKKIHFFYFSQQVTPFMFFLAAYVVLLSKISATTDIIVGTPVSGRSQNGVDRIIGMFVNTLALRFKIPGNPAFYDFLRQVKSVTFHALENQNYPFEQLVQKLNLSGTLGNSPLFDTLFNLDQTRPGKNKPASQSIKITPLELKTRTTLFDLNVSVLIDDDDIKISFTYDIALFKEETIRRWLTDFENLLSRLVCDPLQRIAQLPTGNPVETLTRGEEHKDRELIEAERHRILEEFNNTASPLAADPVIHHRFEQQSRETPDNVALKWADQLLTYRQFNTRTNQLAHWLRKKGVTTGSIVGIIIDRCLEMMLGIFGILKTGGAYLPMSPGYPGSRTLYTLIDSGAALLLTDRNLHLKGGNPCDMAVLKDLSLEEEEETNPVGTSASHDAAYILYTSGTTGNPKGVIVEHHSVVNWLGWMQECYPLNAHDILLQKTPIVFDVSVRELFWWVLPGASLCLPAVGVEKSPRELSDFCTLHNITIIHFVPAMLNLFLDYLEKKILNGSTALPALRLILSSGEALSPTLVERFYRVLGKERSLPLVNLYGPTETTVEVSHYNCLDWEEGKPVPIGKPINNVKMYIMKKEAGLELRPLGIGTEGELCIGGISVGRGYLNRPELTAEKFIMLPGADPSHRSGWSGRSDWSHRFYKTGDLTRWLPDGNIEFLGRMDQQIKIRGYRIESAEIETALLKHPRVREAAVAVRNGPNDAKYLVAGIVFSTGTTEITVNRLRTFLENTLPDYMIPQFFIKLDHMPLTVTGKVDRSKLEAVGKIIETGIQYIPPGNQIEETLARIWAEVLNRDTIGRHDHFFELGGDSLTANLMVAKANEVFGTEISLEKIFDCPNLVEFSTLFPDLPSSPGLPLSKRIMPVAKNERGIYPASSAQKRMYIRNQLEMEDTGYNLPVLFNMEGPLEKTKFENAFRELTRRHESLRTSFLTENGEIMQKINEDIQMKVEFYEIDKTTKGESGIPDIEEILEGKIPLRKAEIPAGETTEDFAAGVKERREKRRRMISL